MGTNGRRVGHRRQHLGGHAAATEASQRAAGVDDRAQPQLVIDAHAVVTFPPQAAWAVLLSPLHTPADLTRVRHLADEVQGESRADVAGHIRDVERGTTSTMS